MSQHSSIAPSSENRADKQFLDLEALGSLHRKCPTNTFVVATQKLTTMKQPATVLSNGPFSLPNAGFRSFRYVVARRVKQPALPPSGGKSLIRNVPVALVTPTYPPRVRER